MTRLISLYVFLQVVCCIIYVAVVNQFDSLAELRPRVFAELHRSDFEIQESGKDERTGASSGGGSS